MHNCLISSSLSCVEGKKFLQARKFDIQLLYKKKMKSKENEMKRKWNQRQNLVKEKNINKYWDNQDETLWIYGEVILRNQNEIKLNVAY